MQPKKLQIIFYLIGYTLMILGIYTSGGFGYMSRFGRGVEYEWVDILIFVLAFISFGIGRFFEKKTEK
jgi:hypothetical protein